MKTLLWALGAILSLALLAVVALLASLLFTAHGGPWAFRLAAELSKGQLQAEGVRGGLLDSLDIARLSFTSPTEKVVVSHAHLRWNPRELRAHRLHVLELAAEKVEVTTFPSPPKPFTPLPQKLPFDLLLDRATVAEILVFPSAAAAGAAPLRLSHCSASGRWDDQGVHLTQLSGYHAQFGGIGLSGLLRLQADAVQFTPLAISGGPGRLLLQGLFGLNGRPSDLTAIGSDLHWPLAGKPEVSASSASLHFSGQPDNAAITLAARLRAAAAPARAGSFSLSADARLQRTAIEIKHFLLLADDAAAGRLSGSGKASWQPALQANAEVQISKLNPALLFSDWPGLLNGRLSVNTTVEAGNARLRFGARLADSRLRDRRFSLDAAGSYLASAAPRLEIENLKLLSGSAVLQARGAVLPAWKAEASLRAPQLADLYPGLRGNAEAVVALSGPLRQPRILANAKASAAGFKTYQLQSALLKADIDPAGHSSARLEASGLAFAARKLSQLLIELDGRLAQHQIHLSSVAPEGKLALSLAGAANPDTRVWQGQLLDASLDARDAPRLHLLAPAPLRVSADAQSLGQACFAADAARACVQGLHAGERSEVQFDLHEFALASLQPLLPKDVILQASLEGRGHISLAGSTPTDAQLSARLGPGRLQWVNAPLILLQSASLEARPDGALWHADLKADTDRGSVMATATLPRSGEDWGSKPLAGTLAINIPSIAFLEGWLKGTAGLQGRVQGNLALAGTLPAPRFAGRLELSEGQARIPAAGLQLRSIVATVTGDPGGALHLEGQLQSGEGVLKLAGTATTTAEGISARITAKGENLQAADLADYRVWVSPDLLLTYSPEAASLTGTVDVPRAAITPRKLAGGVLAPSADAVVKGREKPAAKELPIRTEVKVTLGKDVRFEGFGLKARIEGAVSAIDAPGLAVTRGRGELRVVEGRYKAYGQDLTLQAGRLLFTGGPLTEPTVDFRASRAPREDVTITVQVRGTLNAPRLDLFSSPSMSREEQISWLVLGRPLATTSSAERSQVNSAALSLGFSGGEFLASRLGKTLGIDEVSVGAQPGDDASQARVTIGKYLSPKLYVSYGVGLFERNNVFRLLYDLGHGFKLRTETGLHAGGDVLYTVEH